jgi:hypothetical protein
MKYDRAFIIRTAKSLPILTSAVEDDESAYWLLESSESFHGEYDDTSFYFNDSRIPLHKFPLDCVELEGIEINRGEENGSN